LANLVLTQVRDDAQRRASDARELWKEQKALDAGTIQAALRLASHEPEMFNALIGHLEQEGAISAVDSVPAMRQLYAYLSHDADIRLSALNNWAIALADQGKTMQGIEADRFFAAATQKYAEVLRLKPDDPVALNNWGAALLDRSKKKEGQQADRLIEEAFLKITGALRLKPDYVDALINFGNALFRQASLKTGEQADRLYEEAGQKYAEALTLKPDHPQALNNWANALVSRAKAKQGAESGRLFESACRKYYEALRLKPDFHDALNNLSTALLNQASTEPAAEAERLRLRAREKSLLAEKIRPGSGAYNLACVEALDGNAAEAIRWLQTAQSTGKLLSRAIIAADRDFDRVRNDSGFVSFVESLPEN
jgi:tetratricopeptide (TPR) repeat protein